MIPLNIVTFSQWIKWVMECIKLATVSMLDNGVILMSFFMSKGLCQGDPLSPFLFLLAEEGLNMLLYSSVHHDLFKGYNVSVESPFMFPIFNLLMTSEFLERKVGKILER